jgi:sulfotransferase
MEQKLFFQSSLPRSGSTLLQNVMGQNPDFYVTPTSGVLELVYAARANYTSSPEFKAQDSREMEEAFKGFCHNGVRGFFRAITDKPYVMDKSRGWGIHYNFLDFFYPDPKIICMVRDPRSIFASMEKNFRKNQHKDSGLVDHSKMTGTTTEKRIDQWVASPPVGIAMERLYQIIKEEIDQKILFVKFEDFTKNPAKEMERIYDYLDLPYFEHDFDNVEQITKEDDEVYGIYGDHKIQKKIQPVVPDYNQILGKPAADWIKNNYKWFYDYFQYK